MISNQKQHLWSTPGAQCSGRAASAARERCRWRFGAPYPPAASRPVPSPCVAHPPLALPPLQLKQLTQRAAQALGSKTTYPAWNTPGSQQHGFGRGSCVRMCIRDGRCIASGESAHGIFTTASENQCFESSTACPSLFGKALNLFDQKGAPFVPSQLPDVRICVQGLSEVASLHQLLHIDSTMTPSIYTSWN